MLLGKSVVRSSSVGDRRWDPAKCAVIGLAAGYGHVYGMDMYKRFVGSLRATGYPGHIILGIAPNAPQNVRKYLARHRVVTKEVSIGRCTYYNSTCPHCTVEGKRFTRPKCAADYPDYKIQWGRFPLTADWLRECNGCTDGVMLTDTRDVYFQADPFKDAEPHGLAVFEEHPDTSANHWLTNLPVSRCRDYKFTKAQKMLCSGSTCFMAV